MNRNYYPIKLGLNKNVPFRSYNENNKDHKVYRDINVVAINDPSERATCIVVEKDGKYADFYYNASEENFKQLTEPGYELVPSEENQDDMIGSWEYEYFGITPECILENKISQELVNELIEY